MIQTTNTQTTNGQGHRVVGVLIRNSTRGQRGNYRAETQEVNMPAVVERLGWTPKIYDEQATSGRDLRKRPIMRRLLSDIENGVVHGLAVLDISRATRDQFGKDWGHILEVLSDARGVVVTPGRVLDPRDDSDATALGIEGFVAGVNWRTIRRQMWDGRMRRLEGDDGAIWFGRTPLGYRMEAIDASASKIKRHLVKDPAAAETMEQFITALNREPTIANVAAASGLRPFQVRRILENPLYWGRWSYGTRRESSVWKDHTGVTRDIPHLAYWTHPEALAWQRKFPARDHTPRTSTHVHPLVGLIRCSGCHKTMVGSGPKTLACPKHDRCASPQFVTEARALAAIVGNEKTPGILRDLYRANRERFEEQARRRALARARAVDPVAAVDAQLAVVEARMRAFVFLIGDKPSEQLTQDLADLKAERDRILAQRDELLADAVEDVDEDPELSARASVDFGPAGLRLRAPEDQAKIIRRLLGPAGWVELEKHGERSAARYTVAAWSAG